ncbi:glucosaminidase domain-containing protein [Nonlabens ponticola]|uniref:Peptidoglycan hydrolase n=1 Tax=Nonlabens ponticola TaxID=2496866 RepID=A0A3S9MX57_9FLAO|nr:glucosaminidase domain-containing protein [Nonlabens ponticola]AZQ43821.1 LysM peptidoglycan-binding domain-containing protein [Nonlabens ponticola]
MQVRFYKYGCFFLLLIILTSCGSKKIPTTREDQRTTRPQPRVVKETEEKVTQEIKPVFKDQVSAYIDEFAQDAMEEMALYKIPASITLAQGILESGSGKGRLAVEANNHFGVKCHKGWTGGRIYHDDDAAQECFRKYKDASYSYRDHSLFLTQRKQYSKLFELDLDDYKAWARGLRAAGYATDIRYPQKLISLIERYQLDRYDDEVLGNTNVRTQPAAMVADQLNYTIKAGDTLYGLSKKFNTSVNRIKIINGLKSNEIAVGATILIEPDSK